MRRTVKIILLFASIIILLFSVMIVGVPTYLLDTNIDDLTFQQCQESQVHILKNARYFKKNLYYNSDTSGVMDLRLSKETDLSNYLSDDRPSEFDKILTPIHSNRIQEVEIRKPGRCIIFKIRESYSGSVLIGRSEVLYLLYDRKARCACNDNPAGAPNYPKSVKQIKDNWYIVVVSVSHRYFHA